MERFLTSRTTTVTMSTTGTSTISKPTSGTTTVSTSTTEVLPANPELLNFPDQPHQPTRFKFPPRLFGKKKPVHRSFQVSWFQSWPWLHYNEANDQVLCHYCCKALKTKYISSSTIGASDGAFVSH